MLGGRELDDKLTLKTREDELKLDKNKVQGKAKEAVLKELDRVRLKTPFKLLDGLYDHPK